MDDALAERVEALERTVADGDFDHEQLPHGEVQDRLSTIESQLETIESRLEDLEAGTQALRGYVGNVRAVNDDVEQRAETALAKVEALESSLSTEQSGGQLSDQTGETPATSENQSDEQRCRSCGRKHDCNEKVGPAGSAPPGATDGGSSIPPNTGQQTDSGTQSLVPEDSADTGTLRRIRELL